MDLTDSRFPKKRESRTRAPTACQTCRLRKTRCDNARPTCSYCAMQGVNCIYPETSPLPSQSGYDASNQEILQQLNHISSLLEDLKNDSSSAGSSTRSLHSSLLELATQNPSPLTDIGLGISNLRGGSSNGDYRACEHDPDLLFAASSAELMLRWPIYDKVVTSAEKNIRSVLLDSLDSRSQSGISPAQQLLHRRNPVIDRNIFERYVRELTVHGLSWDGPSCQVLLACALACCTSTFIPLGEVPEDLDYIPSPPPSDANIERAEAYFHAAKQRFGSLHTSVTDIQCFLLAGFYHRHLVRPLEAWFCFQQASCRLEVRLVSCCREHWKADANYHNLESRLYWSCIQAECEMQGELPLWSSRLEKFGLGDRFPSFPTSSYSPKQMGSENDDPFFLQGDLSDTDEERGWRFYIATIFNRRTVNDMLVDMWRNGEDGWINNVSSIVDRTTEAVKVVSSWHQMCHNTLPPPSSTNQDIEFFLLGRYHVACEKIYRPVFYLAIHFQSLPSWVQSTPQLCEAVFTQAQKAIDNCVILLPNCWYHFRHEWVWNILRATFSSAMHILAAVLSNVALMRNPNPGGWALRLPKNWDALVRLGIRILKFWERESVDVEIMRAMLERMFQGTCRLVGARPGCFSGSYLFKVHYRPSHG
ncbi:hypothetical protein N7520_004065 [Penicillium odoratum]|uniref:uncharacterized protein n=1 Tax=Penicillium odoratum TaxID=1167516 RepID=UPI00254769F6|nr:uncharacterized protein N7520_004065 [Penicillium odoratum]KAJ5769506.1 hypothetical protein N7520_004065 [Penicillium odoratum]